MDRGQYLAGIVLVCAAALLGATAYFGAGGGNGSGGSASAAPNATGAAPAAAQGGAASQAEQAGAAQEGSGQGNPAPQAQQGSAEAGPGGNASGAPPGSAAPVAPKKVVVDFLYADWCPHCQNMKPRVRNVASQLPAGWLEVRYLNEADRASNATVAAAYAEYFAKGFRAFPTFVAAGEMLVGEVPESELKAWVCSKFSAPKPAGC